MNDVIHKVEDFSKLPWHELTAEGWIKDWSCGRGGYGFSDGQMIINTFISKKELACDIWPVPEPLVAMIDGLVKIAEEEQLRKIHSALGIH